MVNVTTGVSTATTTSYPQGPKGMLELRQPWALRKQLSQAKSHCPCVSEPSRSGVS